MKDLLVAIYQRLRPLGYRKMKSSFWKVEKGIYRLIDFQSGAYGDYFFVNVCLHPIGFPKILAGHLSIPEHPKEYECIIRQRLEEITDNEIISRFKAGLVATDDTEVINEVLEFLPTKVESWFDMWGDFERLATAKGSDVKHMLTSVPNLRERAYYMLRYYACVKIGEQDQATELLQKYERCSIIQQDLSLIEEYLYSLHRDEVRSEHSTLTTPDFPDPQ